MIILAGLLRAYAAALVAAWVEGWARGLPRPPEPPSSPPEPAPAPPAYTPAAGLVAARQAGLRARWSAASPTSSPSHERSHAMTVTTEPPARRVPDAEITFTAADEPELHRLIMVAQAVAQGAKVYRSTSGPPHQLRVERGDLGALDWARVLKTLVEVILV